MASGQVPCPWDMEVAWTGCQLPAVVYHSIQCSITPVHSSLEASRVTYPHLVCRFEPHLISCKLVVMEKVLFAPFSSLKVYLFIFHVYSSCFRSFMDPGNLFLSFFTCPSCYIPVSEADLLLFSALPSSQKSGQLIFNKRCQTHTTGKRHFID